MVLMKCQICGVELSKPGEICNNCFNKLIEEKKYGNDNEKRFVLKKKFKFWYQAGFYVESLIILLVMLIASIRLGVFSVFIVFFIVMLLIFFLKMIVKMKNLRSTKCTFYDTKLLYQYKFLKVESKSIKYRDIKEITYSQGVWERLFNLGTIHIDTNSGNIFNNGIDIDCVQNVEDVFTKIKNIVNK